ncbi:MAG: sulfatase-like hydrolase/transferase [Sporocytophaga sp.]|uniref:sulfatase-like hydrolase/transferase n=1 Tax=Sporocytophaga sp. TaxID=2231183 RepID=UPI001B1058DF|nr:sulfatase-like hydrolase/transferase [Sporocytophaga sp.]MBO9701974.1 sulfatase-like hydrolase/transferase [Sporocytophaga sp.]
MKSAIRTILFIILFPNINHVSFSQTSTNVIWLDFEDLSPIFSAYGDRTISTPNIDRIAKEGIVFKKAFTTVPVCAPTRSSIITGMYPTSIGSHNMRIQANNKYPNVPNYEVVPPHYVRCFPDILRENGIYTVSSKKSDYQFAPSPLTWDVYPANDSTDRYNFPKDKPFFKQINFWETHESQIWGWCRQNIPLSVDTTKVIVPPYLPQTVTNKLDWATQYNNLKYCDSIVGKILDTLEKNGLLKKTIIILTGDHGNGLPRSKRSLHNSGVSVPLVIRFPDKRQAGTVNNDLVYLMDLGPTILSFYNIPAPSHIHGRNIFTNNDENKRKYVYFSADRFDESIDMLRATSDGRYKYIRNYQPQKPQFLNLSYRKSQQGVKELYRLDSLGKLNPIQATLMRKTKPAEELYDTQNDPYEINNIADSNEHQPKLIELRAVLDQWIRETGDLGFTSESDIAKSFWPNLKQPQAEKPLISLVKNKVTLTTPTNGASIGYKTKPTDQWKIYTKPFELKIGETLYVISHRLGWKTSELIEFKH